VKNRKDALKKLASCRRGIDALDRNILSILCRRMKLAQGISGAKGVLGLPAYAPDREEKHLRDLMAAARGVNKEAVKAVFREVMSAARAVEGPVRVAYFGPEATFTHLAARARFGSQAELIPVATIGEVFREVERHGASYGVVPVENSTEGVVNHTYDMFMDSDLKICAEELTPIHHFLLSKARNLRGVNTVYSHSNIFGQCRRWLENNLHGAKLVEVSSSGEASRMAAKTAGAAAISTSLAARLYNLNILAEGVEDMPGNYTRFFVIGDRWSRPTGRDRTSIMFSIKDRVGALYMMLQPFRRHSINLSSIESRPSKKKAWDYYFFIDMAGHVEDPRVARALKELETQCRFLKLLGSYPAADSIAR
jgi:chorismate mutase/prephenate dehydratase